MSTAVDEANPDLDPEAEVRKLQDLVKKLERQNEILRSKQSQREPSNSSYISVKSDRNRSNCDENLTNSHHRTGASENENCNELLSNVSLDNVDVIEVSEEKGNDREDSWLYASPKRPSPAQEQVSPYKWLRQEFEEGCPDVELTRKSLLIKLEELTRVPRSPSSGTIGSLSSPGSTPVASSRERRDQAFSSSSSSAAATAAANQGVPSIRQPLLTGTQDSRIDTRTYTRPKRKVFLPPDPAGDDEVDFAVPSPRDSPTDSLRGDAETNNNNSLRAPGAVAMATRGGGGSVDENANGQNGLSSSSQESLGTSQHQLNDVMDVQVVAMMQEESLRQSFNSPFTTRKSMEDILDSDRSESTAKQLSRNLNRSVGGLLDGLDSFSPPHNSNRSSPGRFDSDLYKRSNNSLASVNSSNSSASPPASPYGSQDLHAPPPHVPDSHRRSLPNLMRPGVVSPLRLHPSSDPRQAKPGHHKPRRQQHQGPPPSRSSPSSSGLGSPGGGRSGLRTPTRTLRGQDSPGRALSPQRTLSPQRGYSPQRGLSMSPQSRVGVPSSSPSSSSSPPQRNLSPHRAPSPGRTFSPQRTQSPGRTLSPQRSGIPTTKGSSAIPRPGSMSKLPTPNRRSSIPSLRHNLTAPRNLDDSWKDGCY